MANILDEHAGYVSDTVRRGLLQQALAEVIRPGDRVADVGCGSGILGLLCLQAGAGFVHAIDSTAILEVARGTFERAGYGAQVQLWRGLSQRVSLPERVDVIVCDHVGYFGFDYHITEFFTDARRRFLKPGGRMVPSRIALQLCAVDSESCAQLTQKWAGEHVPPEFHWVKQYGVHAKHAVHLGRQDLLCDPAALGLIDLLEDQPDFFQWETTLTMGRDGVFQGLGGWFNCELAQDVWMTNSPVAEQAINRPQVFLPLSQAVPVVQGEQVNVKVMARPADSVIAWDVEFVSSGRKFSQSTWQGMLISPDEMIRRSPVYAPRLSAKGKARMIVLGYCDGVRTSGQIQDLLVREHPGLFPSREEAVRFVSQVLAGDTQ